MGGIWYDSRRPSRTVDRVRRRKSGRRSVLRPAVLAVGEDGPAFCSCVVVDISEGGAKLKVDRPSDLPECFTLILSWGARTVRRCEARWRSATEIGVQFQRAALSEHEIDPGVEQP